MFMMSVIRVVFVDTSSWLWCLNQSCVWRHISLFLVAKSELWLVTHIPASSS